MKWPAKWRVHWIAPLFKKGHTSKPDNYRGIHLTSQLSKVIERLIKPMIEPYLERIDAFGENQFAYRAGHGCRDALTILVMTWIKALSDRKKSPFTVQTFQELSIRFLENV